jgi:SAM-dependent methyltransferase
LELSRHSKVGKVLELGCSTGWRLHELTEKLQARCVGVDASEQALAYGRKHYPRVEFHRGALSAVPLTETFDVVIVQSVLHWIDRTALAASVAEIDRLVRDGGVLSLGDFLPDFPQRRVYHHLPGQGVFTYKQDYAKIFEALGTYRVLHRTSYAENDSRLPLSPCLPEDRKTCVVLQKSLHDLYVETK